MSVTVPTWIYKIISTAHLLSEEGVAGIVQYASRMNRIGEMLDRQQVTPDELEAFIQAHEGTEKPVSDQIFWSNVWSEILGRKVEVPVPPKLKAKTIAAISEFRLRLVYLPKITESDYPTAFVKPAWTKHLTAADTTRRPLEGKWVLVETIAKPDWRDAAGYGDDPLGAKLGLDTRFKKSWDFLHETTLPAVSRLFGLSRRQVRCPSGEEWNLIGNIFNWLREHRGENLPNLGSTNSWEWCENVYGFEDRVIAGNRDYGGLAAVHRRWSSHAHDHIGFRVLAVL